MIDYDFKVKSPSQEVALKMAEILVKKYKLSPLYIAKSRNKILSKPYLFVCLATERRFSINWMPEDGEDYFINHENKEIDINVFIRTNGTMKQQLLKQKAIK